MKKIILILILIPILIFSQNNNRCTNSSFVEKMDYHTCKTNMNFANEEPLILNTFFQIIEDPSFNLTESHYLEAIAYLNITFNKFNIFFKYRGFQNNSQGTLPNMMNFIIQDIPGGIALNPSNILITYKAFTNEENKQSVLAHEVGHIFGLLHTNMLTSSYNDSFTTNVTCNGNNVSGGKFAATTSSSENVTRIKYLDPPNNSIINPDYNAEDTGDFLVGTPASYFEPNVCVDNSVSPPTLTYLYSSDVVDFIDEPYFEIM